MKNKKGFTLVELLAVIVILAVIILIAINAVLPQMAKARKNSFADEVMNYAKAAETKYVSDNADEEATDGDITTGVCYMLKNLHGEYVTKNDSSYTGIVVLKRNAGNTNLYDKFTYIASNKFYYNSTTGDSALDDSTKLKKISAKNIDDGGSSNLTFKDCCQYKQFLDPTYTCVATDRQ